MIKLKVKCRLINLLHILWRVSFLPYLSFLIYIGGFPLLTHLPSFSQFFLPLYLSRFCIFFSCSIIFLPYHYSFPLSYGGYIIYLLLFYHHLLFLFLYWQILSHLFLLSLVFNNFYVIFPLLGWAITPDFLFLIFIVYKLITFYHVCLNLTLIQPFLGNC